MLLKYRLWVYNFFCWSLALSYLSYMDSPSFEALFRLWGKTEHPNVQRSKYGPIHGTQQIWSWTKIHKIQLNISQVFVERRWQMDVFWKMQEMAFRGEDNSGHSSTRSHKQFEMLFLENLLLRILEKNQAMKIRIIIFSHKGVNLIIWLLYLKVICSIHRMWMERNLCIVGLKILKNSF